MCSALVPGTGQLVNGDTDKAIAVLAVATLAGASFLGAFPLLGGAATLVLGATWLYGVVDAFVIGRAATLRRPAAVALSGQCPPSVRNREDRTP